MTRVLSAKQKDELRKQGKLPALPSNPEASSGCDDCTGRVMSANQKNGLREQQQGIPRIIDGVEIKLQPKSKAKPILGKATKIDRKEKSE